LRTKEEAGPNNKEERGRGPKKITFRGRGLRGPGGRQNRSGGQVAGADSRSREVGPQSLGKRKRVVRRQRPQDHISARGTDRSDRADAWRRQGPGTKQRNRAQKEVTGPGSSQRRWASRVKPRVLGRPRAQAQAADRGPRTLGQSPVS